jgi:co-chaperonin GroES (HSP10)
VIAPLGSLLIVRTNPPEAGITLPDWKRALNGTILAVGPEVREAKCGDTAYFGAAVGMDAVFNGEPVRILKEENLDFVYEPELQSRVVEQYTINDDPLPCRCTPGNNCILHSIAYEA